MGHIFRLAIWSAVLVITASSPAQAGKKNGFILDAPLIPEKEIVSGGPPRDGIPAINQPVFVALSEASFLSATDRVLGVEIGGVARAYPVKILNWHELVNDSIGQQHFVVTYCPLCGTGMVFVANLGDSHRLIFGVSGLLYNSDVLLYDRNSESLWSQLMGKAISGKLKGTELPQIPVQHTTFADWSERYPHTEVLSTKTGFNRSYKQNPYRGYERTRRLYFDVSHKAPATFHPKERVLGITIGGVTRAYPFSQLSENGKSAFDDTLNGQAVSILWNETSQAAYALDASGRQIPTTTAFWFAWYTFHPDTEVFKAD